MTKEAKVVYKFINSVMAWDDKPEVQDYIIREAFKDNPEKGWNFTKDFHSKYNSDWLTALLWNEDPDVLEHLVSYSLQ